MTGIPVTRRFMGRRKVADAPAAIRATAKVIAEWEQLRVRTALGNEFRRESRIVLNRPAWMPDRLYRALLRTIIVDARDAS
jgi:hypothetical protein